MERKYVDGAFLSGLDRMAEGDSSGAHCLYAYAPIAEGQGRVSKKGFTQFLALSRGSLLKVETQVLIAADRQYWDAKVSRELESQTQELLRIMNGLMDSLRS